MSVKISELPLLSTLSDNDILAGVDTSENVTSKVELATLKNYIDTNTTYTAGTNIDITNNVVSAPNVYNKSETDEQIEKLQEELDAVSTIYNAFPTVDDEDTSISLDGTAESKFKKLDLKGNTSQETTTGKNLVGLTNGSYSPNQGTGITASVNNNELTISGTASGTNIIDIPLLQTIPASLGTIMKSLNSTGTYTGVQTSLRGSNAGTLVGLHSNDGANKDGTLSANAYYFRIQINDGITVNCVMKVQVELGSTATTYEQYTGGNPAPNPSYPRDVNVVSGDNEINICGKNLFGFNESAVDKTSTYRATANQRLTIVETGNPNEVRFNFNGGTYCRGYFEIEGIDGTSSYTISFNIKENTTNYTPTAMIDTTNSTSNKLVFYISGGNGSTSGNTGEYFILTNIQLEKGSTATTYEPYKGNKYPIYLGVENLIELVNGTGTHNGITATTSNGEITLNGTATANSFVDIQLVQNYTLINGETYTISLNNEEANNNVSFRITGTGTYDTIVNAVNRTNTITYNSSNAIFGNKITIRTSSGTTLTNFKIKPQIEKGSKANSFTPYGTTPIELCKIGDYQDYLYKENKKWYKYSAIGKKVLTGGAGESWQVVNTGTPNYIYLTYLANFKPITTGGYSNYYPYKAIGGSDTNQGIYAVTDYVRIRWGTEDTLANFKTWLSTHNVILYWIKTTPTVEEITDTDLIAQLEALKNATSYEGQTNISQENNDKPFIINAEAILSLKNILEGSE